MKKLLKCVLWAIILFIALFVILAIVLPTSETETVTTSKEVVKTDTNVSGEFKPEHDQEYLDTRAKIHGFLESKGYNVKTDFGVPRILKTDAKLDEGYEGWIATIEKDKQLIDYSVILFAGEVSAIRPVKK